MNLAITLDGVPVHLYRFKAGSYEDTCRYLCAHPERLTQEEVFERFSSVVAQLPEELDCYNHAYPVDTQAARGYALTYRKEFP